MPNKAPQRHYISTQEARNIAVDFSGVLDSGELLTGTPTITEANSPEQLVLTNKSISIATLTINGSTVSAGLAAQFKADASGATPEAAITVDIVCGTDASQTVHGQVELLITD